MAPTQTPQPRWTVALVRDLLVVIYGGRRDDDDVWQPNLAHAARRRRRDVNDVATWVNGDPDGPSPIPTQELTAILRRRRVHRDTVHRETLAHQHTLNILNRAQLGRGAGNITEYADRGWLDTHLLLIVESNTLPLRRAIVTRNTPATRHRSTRGAREIDVAIADSKFAADIARFELLRSVAPWRLELPSTKVATSHTQIWLASAPLPMIPLRIFDQDPE